MTFPKEAMGTLERAGWLFLHTPFQHHLGKVDPVAEHTIEMLTESATQNPFTDGRVKRPAVKSATP